MEIDFDKLSLVSPSMEYMNSFRSAVREHKLLKVEDFNYPSVGTGRAARLYLHNLEEQSRRRGLPPGFVPNTTFWLVDGKNYLGTGNIRHYLNERLKRFGGHIGYSIRPSVWNRGLGTIQLALLLEEARGMNLHSVLITCFDENRASSRVMEKNGGVLVDIVINTINGRDRPTRVYEIDLLKY